MKTEEQIKNKIKEIKELEISTRSSESFKLYATKLLEWVLE